MDEYVLCTHKHKDSIRDMQNILKKLKVWELISNNKTFWRAKFLNWIEATYTYGAIELRAEKTQRRVKAHSVWSTTAENQIIVLEAGRRGKKRMKNFSYLKCWIWNEHHLPVEFKLNSKRNSIFSLIKRNTFPYGYLVSFSFFRAYIEVRFAVTNVKWKWKKWTARTSKAKHSEHRLFLLLKISIGTKDEQKELMFNEFEL